MSNRNQTNNKELTLAREHKAWELRQAGWSQQGIADKLGVSQPAVAKILKKTRNKITRLFYNDIKDVTEQLIISNRWVHDEAKKCYFHNKKLLKAMCQKLNDVDVAADRKIELKVQSGQNEFLRTILMSDVDLAKLMGLNEPGKLETTVKVTNADDFNTTAAGLLDRVAQRVAEIRKSTDSKLSDSGQS